MYNRWRTNVVTSKRKRKKLEKRQAFKVGYRKAMEYMITNRN